MSFASFTFAIFFACLLALRLTVGRAKTEPVYFYALLIGSLLFYGWHTPEYLPLLLATVLLDFVLAKRIFASRPAYRKHWLALSVGLNLLVLFGFKYAPVVQDGLASLAYYFGRESALPAWQVALPIGISFYTFQSLSYAIDVYRGTLLPVRRFGDLLCFVTLFPQLVAGPIVRASELLPQFQRRRRPCAKVFHAGIFWLVRGCFLKLVCADNLAFWVDSSWHLGYSAHGASTGFLWLLVVYFSFQIYCDFEGYSSMARGLAYLLGYHLPENFRHPYLAVSFREFWQRWHITLSRWLRDYLYIPLGGNRLGTVRTGINLMVTMLLGGLWHGANATFVAWGAIHGAALVVERALGDRLRRGLAGRVVSFVGVQLVVLIAWVFFRSETIRGAQKFVGGLFSWREGSVPPGVWWGILFLVFPLAEHLIQEAVIRGWLRPFSERARAFAVGAAVVLVFTFYGRSNAFIYFQF